MPSFGRRLLAGFAYGQGVGFVFYILGKLAENYTVTGVHLGPIGFLVGLSLAIAVAIAEDLKEHMKRTE